MVLYRNLIFFLLLSFICSPCKGQEEPSEICEDVFFYMATKMNKVKKNSRHLPLTLLIDNQSNDTVCIENFNKYIFHKLDFSSDKKTFYWDFLTTSNRKPNDVTIITGAIPNDKLLKEDMNIIIPPNNTFVSDIYIRYSSFIKYGKGYYKLCLYYEKCSKCIAELIIKNE